MLTLVLEEFHTMRKMFINNVKYLNAYENNVI
jgi:hypothetical protein